MIYASRHFNAPFNLQSGRMQVLVVDNQPELAEWIAAQPGPERFLPVRTASSRMAIEKAQQLSPRLVLLAAGTPDWDALAVCTALKGHPLTQSVPVVVVGKSADAAEDRGGEADALERGADDYLARPWNPDVALAKIRAVLRRTESFVDRMPRVIRIHDLVIDGERGRVTIGGQKSIDLAPLWFRLLFALASRPGHTFSHEELAGSLAYSLAENNEHRIRYHIASLRTRLGKAGKYVQTVTQFGYRMKSEARGKR